MGTAETRPGLLRRLGAILYDSLLLLGLLMLATALLMPLTGGAIEISNIAYRLYLLAVVTGYFAGFWLASIRWSPDTLPVSGWQAGKRWACGPGRSG